MTTPPPITNESQADGLLAALTQFADAHDVGPIEPVILAQGSNLVVHLAPAPIVARAANVTVAGRDLPGEWLAREVALAQHLISNGVHTVAPSDLVPPGPHQIAGWSVSFFEYASLTPVSDEDAVEVGTALVELHRVAATLPQSPALRWQRTMRDDTVTMLERVLPRLTASDAAVLQRAADETWAVTEDVVGQHARQPLHGDAHRKNVGRDQHGRLTWFDLDDTVVDYTAVDYAALLRRWPEAGRAACRAAGVDPDGKLVRRFVTQRESYVSLWMQLFGLERPEVHGERAAQEMQQLRERWG